MNSDAFTTRERASEDAFIRQREAEKFAALKKQKATNAGAGYVVSFPGCRLGSESWADMRWVI